MGELSFRRERVSARRPLRTMVVVLAVVAAALLARGLWQTTPPEGVLVEVRGDVPRPGVHRVWPPTVDAAVLAAGGQVVDPPRARLHRGDRVQVTGTTAVLAASTDPLLVALPVDLNAADVVALTAIPGVGPATAEAIVADRDARGPFGLVDELRRVPGIGPTTVEQLAPFVTVSPVGPPAPAPPLRLNDATAAQLERLPGIGPVLAARIVVDRADRGPFERVDDLARVKGVGPVLVEKVRPLVTP